MPSVLSTHQRKGVKELLGAVLSTSSSVRSVDAAILAVRVVLAWIFTYYGAGKLFGAFNGPGIHRTAIFFSTSAHLHPGTLFAVLGGVTELGGAVAMALGLGSRLAGVALLADQVMAMVTVTWANGINSLSNTPGYEFNLTLAVLAFVVAAMGAGRASIDHQIVQRWFQRTLTSQTSNAGTMSHDQDSQPQIKESLSPRTPPTTV